jgi:hypothetical protein
VIRLLLWCPSRNIVIGRENDRPTFHVILAVQGKAEFSDTHGSGQNPVRVGENVHDLLHVAVLINGPGRIRNVTDPRALNTA